MAGPLSCIYDVYMNGHLSTSLAPPIWTVVIGAISLVVGLATYGELTVALGSMLSRQLPFGAHACGLSAVLVPGWQQFHN